MEKEYLYSKGVILFSIARNIEILKVNNHVLYQELESIYYNTFNKRTDSQTISEYRKKVKSIHEKYQENLLKIEALNKLSDLIDNDELLPLPPDNKSFDFDKDEIPFPDDDGLPF